MTEDPIAPIDASEPRAEMPAWTERIDGDSGAVPSPPVTASHLREKGRAAALRWTVLGKRACGDVLDKKRRDAGRAIFHRGSRPFQLTKTPFKNQLVANSQRMLRANYLDIRTTTRSKSRFPWVRTDADPAMELPRAYVAAESFLAATAFAFDEPGFVEFMQAAQEPSPFEMSEIWLLKPMMLLVLLEQIARHNAVTSETPRNSPAAAASSANSAEISRLLSSVRNLNKSTFKDPFLALSMTETILRQDPSGAYPCMEFESCELYRSAIQEFAKNSRADEFTIARLALDLATHAHARFHSDSPARNRRGHVGYYLVDRGRQSLQRRIDYRAKGFRRVTETFHDAPELLYFISLEILIVGIMAFVVSGLQGGVPLIAATILLLLPASEAAIDIINQLVGFLIPPRTLPKLDFSKGIPADCVTVVAIPTLLINEEQIRDLVRTLEIRYAGNRDPNLYFALLTDPPDSTERFDDKDRYVTLCSSLIEQLNRKYSAAGACPFFHFHRHRVFNEAENTWMGWERKRGKLLDFNELLRGEVDRFPVKIGDLAVLPRVRYVITLDSDTQLPRDTAHRMIGTLAHPLNRAEINPATNTVREGYGVLQPRVGISVHSASRSRLAYIYSGQTGLDIYTRAVSDVYQDLFGEGIFTGKGIYDVDVFRQVLGQRFPSNAILSHDLIEGAYARAGLVTDIEIIDDYPSHFGAHSRRKHRWIRGDWQILSWLFSEVPDASGKSVKNPLNFVSRWKILDNLRRSITESATFILLLASWFFLPGPPEYWTAATVALLLLPRYTQFFLSIARMEISSHTFAHLKQILEDFIAGQVNVLIFFTFLAHQTLVTLDAVFRTVVRLAITRRNLLEWETAAQSEMEAKRKTPVDIYLEWTPVVALLLAALLALFRPAALLPASPILFLWLSSRLIARWLDRPPAAARAKITAKDEKFLRLVALRTWSFFRRFSSAEENWLIPDNIQGPHSEIAHRISPTNLGLLLNSQYAAYDLGFITLPRFLEESEKTLSQARRLERFKGHFFNWYDTRSLATLPPFFVSSVDSGNLAWLFLTLKQGCLAASCDPILTSSQFLALASYLAVASEEEAKLPPDPAQPLLPAMKEICAQLEFPAAGSAPWWESLSALDAALSGLLATHPVLASPQRSLVRWWIQEAHSCVRDLSNLLATLAPFLLPEFATLRDKISDALTPAKISPLTLELLPDYNVSLVSKLEELLASNSLPPDRRENAASLRVALLTATSAAAALHDRLQILASDADALVQEMDFRLLYDPTRKMLSVGYDVGEKRLFESCYDLLASESRSAVFIAIAKGDIPQTSWFVLGRSHTQYSGRQILLSWTGTMFEYLMPGLWMKTYPASLLENSMRGSVAAQKTFVQPFKIPWGISECAISSKNDAGHYNYHAYGVPPISLKVEILDRIVIAPYASVLALGVNPVAAVNNLRAMQSHGWLGPCGFYESVDYRHQQPDQNTPPEIVHCWMAHHQGMSMLAIGNLLSDSVFPRLFHEEVIVAATERLLHERVPLTFETDPKPGGENETLGA